MRFVLGILVIGAVAACNALTGVGDLSTNGDCVGCEPGSSSGTSGSSGSSGAGEGGLVDAPFDGGLPRSPGLDGTFGSGGVVISELLDVVTSVALHADGRIVVAGASANKLAVVQLTRDGALDTAFGTGGRVTSGSFSTSRADAVMIDSMDRVVAGGVASGTTGAGDPISTGIVVRVKGGKSDTTFGFGGRRTFSADGEAVTALLPNIVSGGYVAFGRAPSVASTTVGAYWPLTEGGNFVDSSAPRTDVSFSPSAPSSIAAAVADGNAAVFAGSAAAPLNQGTSAVDFAAGRVTVSGLDPAFNGDGKVTVAVGSKADTAFAVARTPGGAFTVGGEVVVAGGIAERSPQVGIVRLDSAGDLDPTWGTAGKVITSFALPGDLIPGLADHLRGIAVDSLGRVIAVGSVDDVVAKAKRKPALLRLGPNGTADALFGTFGLVTDFFDKSSTDSAAAAVVIQPDGKMVVVGTASGKLAVARFSP